MPRTSWTLFATLVAALIASLALTSRAGPGDDEPIGPDPYVVTYAPPSVNHTASGFTAHCAGYNISDFYAFSTLGYMTECFWDYTYDTSYGWGEYARTATFDFTFTANPDPDETMAVYTEVISYDDWFSYWDTAFMDID